MTQSSLWDTEKNQTLSDFQYLEILETLVCDEIMLETSFEDYKTKFGEWVDRYGRLSLVVGCEKFLKNFSSLMEGKGFGELKLSIYLCLYLNRFDILCRYFDDISLYVSLEDFFKWTFNMESVLCSNDQTFELSKRMCCWYLKKIFFQFKFDMDTTEGRLQLLEYAIEIERQDVIQFIFLLCPDILKIETKEDCDKSLFYLKKATQKNVDPIIALLLNHIDWGTFDLSFFISVLEKLEQSWKNTSWAISKRRVLLIDIVKVYGEPLLILWCESFFEKYGREQDKVDKDIFKKALYLCFHLGCVDVLVKNVDSLVAHLSQEVIGGGVCPVHILVSEGHLEALRIVRKRLGATFYDLWNTQNNLGNNSLHLASLNGRSDVLQEILCDTDLNSRYPLQLNAKNMDRKTVFYYLFESSLVNIIDQKCACVFVQYSGILEDGLQVKSLLTKMINLGRVDVIRLILTEKPDILDMRKKVDKKSVFFYIQQAILKGSSETLQLLVDHLKWDLNDFIYLLDELHEDWDASKCTGLCRREAVVSLVRSYGELLLIKGLDMFLKEFAGQRDNIDQPLFQTALYLCFYLGCIDLLMAHSNNIEFDLSQEVIEGGLCSFHILACEGHVEALLKVRDILGVRYDLWNTQNKQGNTVLHLACLRRRSSVIQMIIEDENLNKVYPLQLSLVNENKRTALDYVIEGENSDELCSFFLIKGGAELENINKAVKLLDKAIDFQSECMVQEILDSYPHLLNFYFEKDPVLVYSWFRRAISFSNQKVILLLIDFIDDVQFKKGFSLIQLAISYDNGSFLKRILEKSKKLSVQDTDLLFQLLSQLMVSDKPRSVFSFLTHFLLSRTAQSNYILESLLCYLDEKNRTLLHVSCLTANQELVAFLIDKGEFNVDYCGKDGLNVWACVLESSCIDFILWFVERYPKIVSQAIQRGVMGNRLESNLETFLFHNKKQEGEQKSLTLFVGSPFLRSFLYPFEMADFLVDFYRHYLKMTHLVGFFKKELIDQARFLQRICRFENLEMIQSVFYLFVKEVKYSQFIQFVLLQNPCLIELFLKSSQATQFWIDVYKKYVDRPTLVRLLTDLLEKNESLFFIFSCRYSMVLLLETLFLLNKELGLSQIRLKWMRVLSASRFFQGRFDEVSPEFVPLYMADLSVKDNDWMMLMDEENRNELFKIFCGAIQEESTSLFFELYRGECLGEFFSVMLRLVFLSEKDERFLSILILLLNQPSIISDETGFQFLTKSVFSHFHTTREWAFLLDMIKKIDRRFNLNLMKHVFLKKSNYLYGRSVIDEISCCFQKVGLLKKPLWLKTGRFIKDIHKKGHFLSENFLLKILPYLKIYLPTSILNGSLEERKLLWEIHCQEEFFPDRKNFLKFQSEIFQLGQTFDNVFQDCLIQKEDIEAFVKVFRKPVIWTEDSKGLKERHILSCMIQKNQEGAFCVKDDIWRVLRLFYELNDQVNKSCQSLYIGEFEKDSHEKQNDSYLNRYHLLVKMENSFYESLFFDKIFEENSLNLLEIILNDDHLSVSSYPDFFIELMIKNDVHLRSYCLKEEKIDEITAVILNYVLTMKNRTVEELPTLFWEAFEKGYIHFKQMETLSAVQCSLFYIRRQLLTDLIDSDVVWTPLLLDSFDFLVDEGFDLQKTLYSCLCDDNFQLKVILSKYIQLKLMRDRADLSQFSLFFLKLFKCLGYSEYVLPILNFETLDLKMFLNQLNRETLGSLILFKWAYYSQKYREFILYYGSVEMTYTACGELSFLPLYQASLDVCPGYEEVMEEKPMTRGDNSVASLRSHLGVESGLNREMRCVSENQSNNSGDFLEDNVFGSFSIDLVLFPEERTPRHLESGERDFQDDLERSDDSFKLVDVPHDVNDLDVDISSFVFIDSPSFHSCISQRIFSSC